MHVLTLIKAVSVALAAGALSFLLAEWRFYRNSFANASEMWGSSPDTGRLLRRTVGSSLLLLMSFMMFMGELPNSAAQSPDDVLKLFYYWAGVVGLAVLLGCVALYDAVAGVKRLGTIVSSEEGKELSALAAELRKANVNSELIPEVLNEAGIESEEA